MWRWQKVALGLAPVATAASLGAAGWMQLASAPAVAGARAVAAHEAALRWSAPRVLARCGLAAAPRVAFPSEGPGTPTGPGAIVWAAAPAGCATSTGRGPWGVSVAALGPEERARPPMAPALRWSSPIALTAVGTTAGSLALVAGGGAGQSALLQGRPQDAARWPGARLRSTAPPALARAYLGDVALASLTPSGAIAVSVERYYRSGFAQRQLVRVPAGPVSALTATMDYRSDVLLAWQQNGAIYAHMVRASGRPEPTQRVGPSEANPQLQAIVSDNDHGMIVWSSTGPAASAPRTRTYVSLSAAGVRFGRPQALAAFADPQRVGTMPGSLALRRLSTENVMLAWTTAESGHYVVRAAPAVFAVAGRTTLLSSPGSHSVLADLAPGPAGEAIALWRSAPLAGGGTLDGAHTELWAARTAIRPHAHVVALPPALLAPAGPHHEAAVAVDPGSDRAVATWLTAADSERVEYAVAGGAAGYHPRAHAALAGLPGGGGTRWGRIALGAAALAAAAVLLALARARSRQRSPWRRSGGR